jgi:hypothetical protein
MVGMEEAEEVRFFFVERLESSCASVSLSVEIYGQERRQNPSEYVCGADLDKINRNSANIFPITSNKFSNKLD